MIGVRIIPVLISNGIGVESTLSVLLPVGGNVMCLCLYKKSVCKVYRTEGVYRRYVLYST